MTASSSPPANSAPPSAPNSDLGCMLVIIVFFGVVGGLIALKMKTDNDAAIARIEAMRCRP